MRLAHHQPRWFMSLQRLAGWHQRSLAYIPRWRHPLVGYPVGLLLVGLSLAIGLVEARLLFPFSFPGLLLLFVVVLVALCWGVGAALFTTALSVLALDYLYVPPFGNLGSYGWNSLVQLFTFAAIGIVVAVLTQQRETARVRALEARQEAVLQMRQLEATFEAISDGVVVYDRKGQVQHVNHATRLEAYLGIICHELKTPLTVMRGSLQLADRKVKRLVATELPEPGDLRHFASIQALLERAKAQVAVQDRLVNDLLDISRIQAQTFTLLMVRCNVTDIVQEVVEDQRQVASERTIHLELPAGRDIIVLGDADRLAQVVTNFLTNALKYSPPDRPITVCVRIEHEQARVLVRDEGPGLPSEEHERVWERFYRVPGISEQGGFNGGLGLGLYVCRTIIEQHGGQVGLQSAQGDGATFWFALPLAQQDDIEAS